MTEVREPPPLTTSIHRLQGVCRSLVDAVEREGRLGAKTAEKEWEQLKRERQNVEEKEMQMQVLRKRLKLFTGTAENSLALDVGGQKFVTTRETLLAIPDTLFTVLLSGRFGVDMVDGAIKLDRDPTYFSYILNYLRSCREGEGDASAVFFSLRGVSQSSASRIAQEARFYGLEALTKMAINHTSLIVSKEVDAKYRTISDALQDAKNGDRIVVFPGTYFEEAMRITKEVHVCGEGPRDKIVIVTTDGAPTATCGEEGRVRLTNLSLREMSRFGVCTIDIKGSSVVFIEDCDLTTRQDAEAISVSDEASLTLSKCVIHETRGCAVLLRDKAQAKIQNSEFINLGCAALQAKHDTQYTMTGNIIRHAAHGGIDAKDSARGVVANNSISRCRRGAILLQDTAQTEIQGNVITKNEYGVRCFHGSRVTSFRSNRVYNNTVANTEGFQVPEEE